MEFALNSAAQPTASDGVSSLAFSPSDPNLLLTGNWNKSVSLFNIESNSVVWQATHKAAVLDVCFVDNAAVSCSLDRSIQLTDLETASTTLLGTHNDAVKTLTYARVHSILASGSWDKSVKLWDARANKSTSTHEQPHKVFSIDATGNTLVVGMSERACHIYDLRNMQAPTQKRESSLKFMTRVIRCMPSADGYALGSIEGRIAVEFFDSSSESQARKYAFKCHRQTVDDVDMVYPVNALAFHPIHGTFASGGGDGLVSVWDGMNKKRVKQIGKYDTSISALAFNCTGTCLAIAASYTFEEGEKEHPADSIIIRQVSESDVKPKAK